MESVYLNGGMIGAALDLDTTERYVISTTQERLRPIFVGSQGYARLGSTSATTVSFSLTGGSSTTPAAGDIVILSIAIGAASTTLISAPAGYTQLALFAASDTYDSVLYVGYKIMTSTPDTTFPIPSSLSTSNAQVANVFVWRNIDSGTPIDVATVTATGANSTNANPPSITPTTTNAIIMGIGAAGHVNGTTNFSSSNLSGFISNGANDTYDASLGAGYYLWDSGSFDPAAFTMTSTTSDSWTAVTLAIRPSLTDVPVYGNLKNSGIWNIQSVFNSIVVPVDPYWSSVSLLLSMDGANNSTTFTDSSSNSFTVTPFNGTVISTAQSVFGDSSGLFNSASSNYLRIAENAAFDFGTGDFTVECWINSTSFTTDAGSILSGVGSTNGEWMLAARTTTSLSFGRNNIAWDATTSGFTMSTGVWYHVAVSRTSGVLKIFINGTSYYSGSNTQTYDIYTYLCAGCRQGASGTLSYANFFNGYIDEVRITKGVGRYTANFVVPTTPFPTR